MFLHSFVKQTNRGMTLIEMMVGFGLLTVVFSALMYMVNFAYSEKSRVVSRTVQEKILQSIAADLRADSSVFQKNFAPETLDNATILAEERLPYRWDDRAENFCDSTAENARGDGNCCPGCNGKMGYTIRPVNGAPGMFMATVRLTSQSLTGGEAWYEFIVVPK